MHPAIPLRTVFCLMGPTAIGKSDLALRLAETLPIEIVSVDSALIYRHMDIGTAKPDSAMLAKTPHHLINIINPDQHYSAGAFCRAAVDAIEAIFARQKIPLLVGGTMLYFKSLQQGILDAPSVPLEVRQQLLTECENHGLAALYAELSRTDPLLAAKLHPHDQQRILRGLEVYRSTGQCLSLFQKAVKKQAFIHFDNLIILPEDRGGLQTRINQRFKIMLEQGFIEEVQALRANFSLNEQMNSMRSVGYRQVWQYLDGELTEEALIEQGSAATRQLAKRQLTWLRTWPEAQFFYDTDSLLLAKLSLSIQQSMVNSQ